MYLTPLKKQRTRLLNALLFLTVFLFTQSASAILIDASVGIEITDLSSTDRVVLEVDGTGLEQRLLGAYNVEISGQLWDVRFVDGTVGNIYNNGADIDTPAVFLALSFAEAIGEQVLRDSSSIFKFFNFFPQNVNGCGVGINPFSSFCDIIVPYRYQSQEDAYLAVSLRNDVSLDISNIDLNTLIDANVDTSNDSAVTLTEWATSFSKEFRITPPVTPTTPTGSVPEPSVLMLMLVGLLVLFRDARKKVSIFYHAVKLRVLT